MNFIDTLNSVTRCFAKQVEDRLPSISSFDSQVLKDIDNNDFTSLEDLSIRSNDVYLKSVINRILAVKALQKVRDNDLEIDITKIWKWISGSFEIIPSEATVSSIGSQGFLSIPLFKYDKEMNHFDFIRLHIWDNSLEQYFDKKKSELFSIHTHSFLAQSWPLVGKVVNNRYRVNESSLKNNASLFTIEYNKSLNEINQHTSVARNTGRNVNVEQISNEVYYPFSTYKIKHGDFHKSISLGVDGLSATLFSFTGNQGIASNSFVLGPMDIDESEINRKMHIDATYLLKQVNSIINKYE